MREGRWKIESERTKKRRERRYSMTSSSRVFSRITSERQRDSVERQGGSETGTPETGKQASTGCGIALR